MRHVVVLTGLVAVLVGRADLRAQILVDDDEGRRASQSNKPEAGPPAGVVHVDLGTQAADLWPFTGDDFGHEVRDPINLVFLGEADPRQIRAALMSVSGDRRAYGLPDARPFNCTWADAIGFNQTGYADGEWAASAIQLECGDYTVLRTHLRLFRFQGQTLANAHFELMPPGTADHFPFTWAFAEQFVVLDLVRSGLLASPPGLTEPINPAPTYRTVDHRVVNALPLPVRMITGMPLTPQSAPVPIPNGDGRATVLHLANVPAIQPLEREIGFVRAYDTIAPKPFCNMGQDYVRIQGPLDLVHRVSLDEAGEYRFEFEASGVLAITPVDARTGASVGPTVEAHVRLRQHSVLTDGIAWGEDVTRQTLMSDPEQALFKKLRVGNQERFELDVDCGN